MESRLHKWIFSSKVRAVLSIKQEDYLMVGKAWRQQVKIGQLHHLCYLSTSMIK